MTAMWDMVRSLPDQLRWASGLQAPILAAAEEVLVVGMGGSGVAGDYAGPLAAEIGIRVTTHKSYGLPGWAPSSRPLVVAISYSGDTEETLSGVELARHHQLPIAVIAGGGELTRWASEEGWPVVVVPHELQPRAAIGYLLGGLLRIVEAATSLEGTGESLEQAAQVAEGLLAGPGLSLASDLADGLAGRIVVVYGSEGPTAAVAKRWKTQINENAKTPCYAGVLPEADHNELAGWEALPDLTRRSMGAVMLRDTGEPPQLESRFRLTREAMMATVPVVGEVHAVGEGLLARMVGLTVVGDALSVYLAERAGVDPVPVRAIEELKQALRGER